MIKSMTGYGASKVTEQGFSVSVELKSVNNKYLETSIRLPRGCLSVEDDIKKIVQEHISRGKVDVFVNLDTSGTDLVTVKVNDSLAESYIEAVKHLSERFEIQNDLTAGMMSRYPDVLSIEKADIDDSFINPLICACVKEALIDFDSMRIREGEKLKSDIEEKLSRIKEYVSYVEQNAPLTVEAYRKRLEQKLFEVLQSNDISADRIVTEAAIFADHIAVDEETVRLRSHISQLEGMLAGGSPIGRKMDFLIQEFNREANTIGSKCQNSDIAHTVVDLKSEIEKIREQIQNIE